MNAQYTHVLKTWPEYFSEILSGAKVFEIREDDRDFHSGDIVELLEYVPGINEFTGRSVTKQIGFITDFQQRPGYVVFSLLDIK